MPRHHAAIDEAPRLADARPNRSFTALNTEVVRALNALHRMRGGERSVELRVWFTSRARSSDVAELAAAIEPNIEALPFSDASPALARLHDDMFAAYGDRMMQPVRSGRLFEPRDAQIRYAQPRYLMDRSARDRLEEIYTAFLTETGRVS